MKYFLEKKNIIRRSHLQSFLDGIYDDMFLVIEFKTASEKRNREILVLMVPNQPILHYSSDHTCTCISQISVSHYSLTHTCRTASIAV